MHFVLPTDERASRWDLANDFVSPAAVKQLVDALVPPQPNDSNPFFSDAVRDLMQERAHRGLPPQGRVAHRAPFRVAEGRHRGLLPQPAHAVQSGGVPSPLALDRGESAEGTMTMHRQPESSTSGLGRCRHPEPTRRP